MKTPFTYCILPFSFFLLSIIILPNDTFAQAVRLDSSFGINGVVQANFPGSPENTSNTVLVQSDGKIVVCGNNESQGLLLRYNVDGSLDPTFGHNGIVQEPSYNFKLAALEPDDKVVVIADSTNLTNFHLIELIRYNTNGSLDSSFGNGGITVLDAADYIISMSVAKNGKLVIGYVTSYPDTIVISRYLADGKIDTGFNHTGFLKLNAESFFSLAAGFQSAKSLVIAITNYSDSTTLIRYDSTGKEVNATYLHIPSYPTRMAVQNDDKIILAYEVCGDSSCSFSRFVCLRTNPDGSPDSTFNHTGIDTIYSPQIRPALMAISLDKNNRIILSGLYTANSNYYNNALMTIRLLPDGRPDSSFALNGEADLLFDLTGNYQLSMAVQNDNKILITGNSEHGEDGNVRMNTATLRYDPNGNLDQSFATGGIDTPYINSRSPSSAISILSSADGKILVGGTGGTDSLFYYVIRYNEDGTADSSFNVGKPLRSPVIGIPAAAIDDGKLVEIYRASDDSLLLFRYDSDGSADNSFGKNGQKIIYINDTTDWDNEENLPILIQTDGKILLPGTGYSHREYFYSANMARLNVDGSVDSTFGTNGISSSGQSLISANNFSLIQQPDGKIILGAEAYPVNSFHTFFELFRFNKNGFLDAGFGTNGVATNTIDNLNMENKEAFILLQADGKIVQVGARIDGDSSIAGNLAVRYNANGSIDKTFGVNGIVRTFIPNGYGEVTAGAIQPDGKILIASNAYFSCLVRYLSDGKLDTSFGTKGILKMAPIPPGRDYNFDNPINAVCLDSDKILIAGYNDYRSEQDMYVARFTNDIYFGKINFSSDSNTIFIYPDPVHLTATLQYTLSESENITIDLYDLNGKLVQTFIANQNQAKGNYSEQLNFNPSLEDGNYFLTIGNGRQKETVKIIKQ